MATKTLAGGTFTMAEGLTVTRMGYGAMQQLVPASSGRLRTATPRSRCYVR